MRSDVQNSRLLPARLPVRLTSPASSRTTELVGQLGASSIQQILMRNQPNHLVLCRIANQTERIAASIHCLDGFFVQAAQENHATIGIGQMLGGSVVNRPLAFLREPIMI